MHNTSEFIVLFALGLAGVALDLLFKIREWAANGVKPKIGLTIVNTVISVLIVGVLIFLKDEIKEIFVVTKFSAFILGYTAQSVFRKITAGKAKETKIEPEVISVALVDEPSKPPKDE